MKPVHRLHESAENQVEILTLVSWNSSGLFVGPVYVKKIQSPHVFPYEGWEGEY